MRQLRRGICEKLWPMLPPRHRLACEMQGCQVNLILLVNNIGQREVSHELMDELSNCSMAAFAIIFGKIRRIMNQRLNWCARRSTCIWAKHAHHSLELPSAEPSLLTLRSGKLQPNPALVSAPSRPLLVPVPPIPKLIGRQNENPSALVVL